jgi:hypothetical protein
MVIFCLRIDIFDAGIDTNLNFISQFFNEMADNYLEKKYDEYLHGRNVVRKVNPTLDGLLGRLAPENRDAGDRDEGNAAAESGYLVKQAQLDAVMRSASMLALPVEMTSEESRAEISLRSTSAFALGQASLACRLKAAELHLCTALRLEDSGTQAVIHLFR